MTSPGNAGPAVSAKAYFIAAAVTGACALGLLIGALTQQWEHALIDFGVILLFALTSSILLFGVMRATGKGKGTLFGVSFELGGSAALFVLVMLAGMQMVNGGRGVWSLVVRAVPEHEDDPGIQGGGVRLEAGMMNLSSPFNTNGEAHFQELPRAARGDSVTLIPGVPGYAPRRYPVVVPRSNVITIRLSHTAPADREVTGIVTPPPGPSEQLEVAATVVASSTAHAALPAPEAASVSSAGTFTLVVRSRETDRANLRVRLNGAVVFNAVHAVTGPVMLFRPPPSQSNAPPSVRPVASNIGAGGRGAAGGAAKIAGRAVTNLRAFHFTFSGSPGAEPGRRDWRQVSATSWVEVYPTGQETRFTVVGRESVRGAGGIVLRREPDRRLETFIPDDSQANRTLYWRLPGTTEWHPFAEVGK